MSSGNDRRTDRSSLDEATGRDRERIETEGPPTRDAAENVLRVHEQDGARAQDDLEIDGDTLSDGSENRPEDVTVQSRMHAFSEGAESGAANSRMRAPPEQASDPFAEFEDDLASEPTQIDTAELIAEQPTGVRAAMTELAELRQETGREKGSRFVLQPGETTIGRSLDNDVVLVDVAISRRHVSITKDARGLTLRDFSSGNGTRVNGKRVSTCTLVHGDRIRIGETVLSVHFSDGLGRRQDPETRRTSHRGAHETTDSHSGGWTQASPTPLEPFSAESKAKTPLEGVSPRAESARIVLSRRALAGLLIGACALAIGMGSLLTVAWKRAHAGPGWSRPELAAPLLTIGRAAYEAERWSAAEDAFRKLLALEPTHAQAQVYLRLIHEAREHERWLAEARLALQQGDGRKAMNLAASVPVKSPVHARAEATRFAARARVVEELLSAARDARSRGQRDEAERLFEEARAFDAKSALVVEFARAPPGTDHEFRPEISGPGETGPGDSHLRRTPRGGRGREPGARSWVLAAYRQGRFVTAAQLARVASEQATKDPERREFEQLAERITRFSRDYDAVQKAGADKSGVSRQLQNALVLDAQISGGAYRSALQAPLVATLKATVEKAWAEGRVPEACLRVQEIAGLEPTSRTARTLGPRCEQRADEMLREAEAAETNAGGKARALYREILTMVPRTSASYRFAYRRLNALAHDLGADEDE